MKQDKSEGLQLRLKKQLFFFFLDGILPEFLTLELFSLESLMTKCLIHRVGAVISEREKITALKKFASSR